MAKTPRASMSKVKTTTFNSKWLKNAIRSIGISSNEVIKDIAPNLHEVTSSGVKTSTELVSSLRRNRGGTQRINDTLKQNKYVQYATKAYKNALSDIKSGNFNNTERMSEAFDKSMMDGLEEATDGFSFGDAGDEESSNVNVNYIAGGGDNSAILSLGEQIQKQAVAQTKMSKAHMDAYVAVTSAGMQQIGQLGGDILNQLSNVNSNLSALVQYNNENITKFIEASLAYYDNAGSKSDSTSGSTNDKITAANVLNGSKGGVNLSQYKALVKQQTKKMLEESDVGLVKSLADDPMMMEMIVSNPLSFLTKGLTSYMMPKILKTSLESMESTFSNMMPTLLSELADLADDESKGIVGNLKRKIGKSLGLRNERITTLNGAKVERGAIPFDGETKHAITEIITKELRSQTGYLQVIANHFDKNADNKAKDNGEYWDWNSNSYIKRKDIDSNIANEIVDSISSAFESTKFGKSMQNLVTSQRDDKTRKEMEFTLREIYTEIEKQEKTIHMNDLLSIINTTGASSTTKRFIKQYVKDLQNNDRNSFDSVNIGRIQSQQAANDAKQRILDDPSAYHLYDSKFSGTELDENGETVDVDFDRVLSETMGFGKNSKGRRSRGMKGASVETSDSRIHGGPGTLSQMVASAGNHANDIMRAIMSGDASQIFDKGASLIQDQVKIIGSKVTTTLFGEKDDETGNRKGGMFGSLRDSLTNTADTVRDSIKSAFLGKESTDSQGNTSREGGIFDSVVKTFKSGMNGWMDSFFGTDSSENSENARSEKLDQIKTKLQKDLPYGLGGAAVGAGVSIFAGSSLLGTIIGGPFAGAAMGAVGGFLSRNEKFQNYLFGEKDEDGNRVGGLISKNTQDFFKKNKDTVITGGTVGAGVGLLTGGGVLGTLVGGPIAGAMLGAATGLVVKSKTFNEFLFGNEDGKEGIIKGIKNRFQEGFKKTRKHGEEDSDIDTTKLFGMTALGTGAGGLLGMMAGGPVVGAMAGLALSIKASSGSFKEFLFGKEDGLTLADGTKTKKQGLFGKFGNMLDANVMQPLKTEVSYIVKDFNTTLKHDLLGPISGLGKFFAGKAGELFGNISNSVQTRLENMSANNPNSLIGKLAGTASNIMGKGISGIMDVAYNGFTKVLKTPIKLLTAVAKTINLKDRIMESKPVKAVTSIVKTGVTGLFKFTKGLIKDTFSLIMSPFKLLGKGIKGIGSAIGKGVSWIADKTGNSERLSGVRSTLSNFASRVRSNMDLDEATNSTRAGKAEHKANRAERDLNRRINKNDRLITKWTGGQFNGDSEEARLWLQQHDKQWNSHSKQLDSDAADIVKQRNIESDRKKREERDGKSSLGMSESAISRAPFATLSDEAKQVSLLSRIYTFITGKQDENENNETEGERAEFNNTTGEVFKAGKGQKISNTLKRDIIRDNTNGASYKDLSEKYNIPVKTIKNICEAGSSQEVQEGEPDKNSGTKAPIMGNSINNLRDAFKFLIGKLPGHAKGGETKENSLSIVGEEGPEIVETKSKSKVHPFSVLKNMVSKIAKSTKKEDEDDPTTMRDDLKREQKKSDEAEEDRKATLEEASRASMEMARDRAKTAEELKAEKEREEEKKDRKAMLEQTKRNADATEKHAFDWSEIFSKKGLVTAAAVAALAWASKNFPGLLKNVASILGKVGNFATSVISGAAKDAKWTEENNARTDGNSTGEQLQKDISDVKSGNILTDDDGNATTHTNARFKLLKSEAKNIAQSGEKHLLDTKATKTRKKVYSGIKSVASKAKSSLSDTNALAKLAASEGDEAYDILSNSKVQKYGAKAINKVKSTGTKLATAASETKGGKIMNTVISYVTDFFKKIAEKFQEKAGKKIGESLGKISSSKIGKVISENWSKWSTKITSVFTAKTTIAGVTIGVSDVVFATLDAIDGLSGTAKLFQVDSKKVDGKMRTISAILGAVTGTTVGSILDVVFSLVGDVLGFDILHEIAVALYNMWVGQDSDKAKALESNMESFKDAYKDYQEDEIRKAYEKQLADGTISADVSYEDFVKGVEDGTYEVSYKSFQDWNVEKNGSISDKVIGGIGKAVKGTGKAIKKGVKAIGSGVKKAGATIVKGAKAVGSGIKKAGSAIKTGAAKVLNTKAGKAVAKVVSTVTPFGRAAKAATSLMSKKENVYMAADGTYYDMDGKHYSVIGDELDDSLSPEEIQEKLKNGELTLTSKSKGPSSIKEAIGNAKDNIVGKAKQIGTAFADTAKSFVKNPIGTIKNVATSVAKKSLIGKAAVNFVSKKEKVYMAKDGTYYDDEGKHYSVIGDELDDSLTSEEVQEKVKTGELTVSEKYIGPSGIKDAISNARASIKGIAKKIGDTFNNTVDKATSSLEEIAAKTDNPLVKIAANGGAKFLSTGKKLVSKVFGSKVMVWYDTDGNYYQADKSGDTYTKYNANGDELDTGIESSKVEEMATAGLLTQGEKIEDGEAKKAVNKIKDSVKNAWSKAKDTVTKGWDSFKKFITGGSGATLTSAAKSASSGSKKGGKGGYGISIGGGFGDGTYFSQNDPRWKDTAYNVGADRATMGNTGCGPTAMAMAASDITGANINPMQMASLAKATGNRDETGTNWNFINDASRVMGMNTTQVINPSASDISASLDSGNPVILSGASGSDSSTTNPYTKAGHYVVATGKDSNGNVMVKDPRGQSYNRKYKLNELAATTGSSWSFGGSGTRRKRKKSKFGGRGPEIDRSQWIATIKAVKAAYAAAAPEYHADLDHDFPINIGGKELMARPDCSGLVSACLKCYGVLDTNLSSADYANPNNQAMLDSGFTPVSWSGWDSLTEGDIIAKTGHVEIFAYNENGQHYVYNGGSTNALQSAGATVHAYPEYTLVWTPGGAGDSAVAPTVGATSSSSSSSSSASSIDTKSLAGMGSLLSSFLTNAATGILSGNKSFDFSSPFKSGEDTSNSSSSSSTGKVASNVSSSSDALQRVFNDTWQYEMGKGGPGTVAAPLNDGAGYNYGIASFTQNNSMDGLVNFLSEEYPDLRAKLSGNIGSDEFNNSWKALGESDEQRFFDAQLRYELNNYLTPALDKIKNNTSTNLNNGKYSEGVFSLLLSMANQRPAWVNEKWIPYLNSNPNASSADIINAIGGDIANNYNGNYAESIRNRYTHQVANSLALTTPFTYGGSGLGIPRQRGASIKNRRFYVQGGRGKDTNINTIINSDISDVQSKENTSKFKTASVASKYVSSTDSSSLIRAIVELLSDIANNTSSSNSKLDALAYLKSISEKGSSNIIVSGGGGRGNNSDNTKVIKTNSNKGSRVDPKNTSRSDAIAYAIARGGI